MFSSLQTILSFVGVNGQKAQKCSRFDDNNKFGYCESYLLTSYNFKAKHFKGDTLFFR